MTNDNTKSVRRLGKPGDLKTFQYLAVTADGTEMIIYARDMSEAIDKWLGCNDLEPHSIQQMADNE
jgi:hypothetical protein